MKIISVVGARPNFMKIAPIIKEIQRRPHSLVDHVLVHTGQHYDNALSDIFFRELDIPAPDINLAIGSGTHAEQTARIMMAFEPICRREKPDWIVVVGDVNSTMACTLVASKLGIKVAHVEAGLRSHDRTMPEEINRIVTDALADLLLTPSDDADENLIREGVPASRIRLVGNVMVDTLLANLEKARSSQIPDKLGLKLRSFAYVTLHRPSNVDDRISLTGIMEEFCRLARRLPVVFPIHPRTRKSLDAFGIEVPQEVQMQLIEPVGYHDSLWLTENARFVLTDSGGIQEESTYLRTPCLTLRPNTERPVTVEVGTNKLTRIDQLPADIEDILQERRSPGKIPKYWDGRAAERVLDALLKPSVC
jgi:UDP-N-acetylglucosamine 2-epimerase (non-hydrolysing)